MGFLHNHSQVKETKKQVSNQKWAHLLQLHKTTCTPTQHHDLQKTWPPALLGTYMDVKQGQEYDRVGLDMCRGTDRGAKSRF